MGNFERLGDVFVHPGVARRLTFFGQRAGRHGDNRQGLPFWIAAYFAGRLQAIHDRHLHIHQDASEVFPRQAFERFAAVAGDGHKQPDRAQQLVGDFLIDRFILDQQDFPAGETANLVVRREAPILMAGQRAGRLTVASRGQRLA